MGAAMHAVAQDVFKFEGFTLDLRRGCLRAGEREVQLRPKSFEVLRYLVANSSRLVRKDEIVAAVWSDVSVTDDALTRCVSEVRLAIGDSEQRIIKTVQRRGYLFAVPVLADIADGVGPSPAAFAVCPGPTDLAAAQTTGLPFPDQPSIAVLPFTNMSGDLQQDYFSDGITEDLTTRLSKFGDLFVIACQSALRYKGTGLDARQIGHELGVRYLLIGSVRRDAARIRITAQLVHTGTGAQVWAEHYDRELTGIFTVQDEVTQKIIVTLVAHVTRSELARALRKPPETLAAYDHCLRGNAIMKNWHGDTTGEMIAAARALYERSIAADANYAPPVHGLAYTYLAAWIEPWPHKSIAHEYQQEQTLDHAVSLAQRAVELDPNLPEAHLALGAVLRWQHRHAESMAEFERAFELNPNLADYRAGLAFIHYGQTERGMNYLQRIIRLDPFYTPACLTFLGNAYYQTGEYAKAIESLRNAARRLPVFRPTHVWLAAAAAQLGHDEEAREAVAKVLSRDPQFTIIKWLRLHAFERQEDVDHVAEGLRKAGFPQ
jgi:TolB-like protein/Tfp pilus assembly protein PilF